MRIFINQFKALHAGGDIDRTRSLGKAPFLQWNNFWAGRIEESFTDYPRAIIQQDRVVQIAVDLVKSFSEAKPEAVFIGTARGATATLEEAHAGFLKTGKVPPRTSPLTTLGNVASAAAQFAGLEAKVASISMTCSSGLHAIVDAVDWVEKNGGVVLAGGVEAPLTDFTRAQFEALRLLTDDQEDWPCQPLTGKTKNQLVLAEGGAVFQLSLHPGPAEIKGYGEAASVTDTSTSFAGEAIEAAMRQACVKANWDKPDLIIAHAPGTIKGDEEELEVIQKVFGDAQAVCSTKSITGHTLGASGPISMAFALDILEDQSLLDSIPFKMGVIKSPMKRALINATGFGGNAISIAIEKVD